MDKPKVYVETTIFSYLAARPSKDIITAGRQLVTQRWWATQRSEYNLVISEAVEEECRQGDPEMVAKRLTLLRDVSIFRLNESILRLSGLLVVPGAIPVKAAADAVHVAAAVVDGCNYILTWNLRHLVNAQIRAGTERILTKHGYTGIIICTPDQLG